jgi:hypothetical protein
MRPARSALVSTIAALLFVSTLVAPAASAGPAADTKAPTRPRSLRITAVGAYAVSLSWGASSDDSGSFSYVVQASNGYTMTVPQTSTSATFANVLFPRNTYSLWVYAVDGSGNRSANSNTVRTTMLADTSVPSTPAVTVTDVGPNHVSFSWSSTDDDPYLSYFPYIDGVQVAHSTTETSGTFFVPNAATSYAITVKARDHGINFSATSAPLVFTTDPIDTSDVEPPTTPVALDVLPYDFDREIQISWPQSTDNVDAQQAIRYEIYINGVLSEFVVGRGWTNAYAEIGSNLIVLYALDSAGNRSGAVSAAFEL